MLLASGFTKQLGDGTDDSSASLKYLAGSLLRKPYTQRDIDPMFKMILLHYRFKSAYFEL